MEDTKDNNYKDTAKEKIILFIIGVLVGAAISTAAFFVYTKTLVVGNINNYSSQQMPNSTPPEKPSGDNSENNQNGGTPPEMPNNSNSQNSQNNTPPEKPSDDSSNNGNS